MVLIREQTNLCRKVVRSRNNLAPENVFFFENDLFFDSLQKDPSLSIVFTIKEGNSIRKTGIKLVN